MAVKYLAELDPGFAPLSIELRDFAAQVEKAGGEDLLIAIERDQGFVARYDMRVLPDGVDDEKNFLLAERVVKSLLWMRGGYKITLCGPKALCEKLKAAYAVNGLREFDRAFMSGIYESPFEVIIVDCPCKMPAAREGASAIGRHLDGCRIGFDAGGSDRKVSAVIDGETVYSEEVLWFPKENSNPQYQYDGILEAMKTAASHMPRVDAIGVSSAGVYINNPDPADRLHLRSYPSTQAPSLGKYYNGAPITVLEDNGKGWVRVRVGLAPGSLIGWMQKSFLLNTDKVAPASAMPQYRNAGIITVFQQPSNFSVSEQIEPNQVFSLMGFSDSWWHLLVTLDSGTYSCFVRAGAASLYLVEGDSVPQLAHISNPDNSDRLNLRASPSKSAKSLGKYYNGAVASVLGFSEDGEWVRVDVYGRQGYMQRRYLTLEGDGPNSTRIGIPRIQVTAQSTMFYDVPDTKTEARIMLVRGETVEVMGVIDDTWLHVRYGDLFGYMRRADTDFVE